MRTSGLAPRPLTEPHPDRLDRGHPQYDEIIPRHSAAIAAGDSGYTDPATGLFVLAAGFLANRGTCCDNGCRHCPYVR